MQNPHISRIRIYPVKSLDPVELKSVEIGMYSLLHDREYALIAHDGRFVNGKRTGRVNQLKAEFDLENQLITLGDRTKGDKQTFALEQDNPELTEYLEDFFGLKLSFIKRTQGELMDIPKRSSVTIVSEASYQSLLKDILQDDLETLRLRFRANLEIGGVDPYWEEQLFGEPGVGVRFKIGEVEMLGIDPRARCNVPPRNPLSGETDKSFVRNMLKSREEHLPENSSLPQFGHLYHLTVNTYLDPSQIGKTLNLGDPIEILEKVQLQA